nr:MAG TPA: Integrase [Caudoviricetes sp.]
MWIEKLENGKYKFFERYKDPYTEKWRRVSVTLDSGSSRAKKEAQKILDEKIELKLGSLKSSDMLFTALFDNWWGFYRQGLKNSSIASLEGNIREIREKFGRDTKVTKIDPLYIQKYLDSLEGSRSKKERHKSMLNLVFDYAVEKNILTDNPARRARLPKQKKTLDDWQRVASKYLEKNELQDLLKELYSRPNTYRIGLLAEFMSLNGGRIGEIITIRPENRDYETRKLQLIGTIDRTAGYKQGIKTSPKTVAGYRTTDMTKREMEIMQELEQLNQLEQATNPNYQNMGYIFTSKNGIPIQINSFNLAIKRANERLDNPIKKNLSSHIFRHTLISRLAEKNVPLRAIMERVGHSDAKTTNLIYTHVTDNMRSQVVDALEDD